MSQIYQSNGYQHAVTDFDNFFYRYDFHDGKFSKHSITYLVDKY